MIEYFAPSFCTFIALCLAKASAQCKCVYIGRIYTYIYAHNASKQHCRHKCMHKLCLAREIIQDNSAYVWYVCTRNLYYNQLNKTVPCSHMCFSFSSEAQWVEDGEGFQSY